MSEADRYADWLVSNQKKRGTPEYEAVAAAFREIEQEQTSEEEPTWMEAAKRGFSRVIPQIKETYEGLTKLPGVVATAYTPKNIVRGVKLLGKPETYQQLRETYKEVLQEPIERYGSTARAKETLATDPLGFAMDVSLVGRSAGTVLRQIPKAAKLGAALERGAEIIDPLTMASRVVTKVPREIGKFRFGAPDTTELRAMKDAAYLESEQAGALFNPKSLQQFAADAKQTIQFNPKNNPKILNLIEDIDDTVKTPQTLKQVDELRQRIKDVEASIEPSDRRLAGQLREKLDDFVDDSLQNPANFITGQPAIAVPALQKARQLNSQMRKAETLERLLSVADLRASGYTASGLENAIRAQIREFVKDPKAKKLRGFTKEEVAALREVAEGGSITNLMRMVGRFTPTGPVSALPAGLVGSIDPVSGAMIAGGAVTGRIGATGGTKYAVQQAGQLIRGGKSVSQRLAETLEKIDAIKRAKAKGEKVDPYYARQLAAQLARIEAEEQEQE